MKKLSFLLVFLMCISVSLCVSGQTADDGTPEYRESVEDSYRKLMIRTSIYEEVPEKGTGIRLGIYQAPLILTLTFSKAGLRIRPPREVTSIL